MKYIKGLIITLIYLYETNGQVDQIKEHVNPNANELQTQWDKVTQSIQECPMSIDQKFYQLHNDKWNVSAMGISTRRIMTIQ